MQDSQRATALRAALGFVVTDDMPSEHKATLIEVLTQALRDDDAATNSRRQAAAHTPGEWQEHEIVHLKTFLPGRIAKSWQHADECVMHLAAQLHRDPRSVRDKATELGFGAAVDYRFSKALKRASSE
jgi:hypothetical protein